MAGFALLGKSYAIPLPTTSRISQCRQRLFVGHKLYLCSHACLPPSRLLAVFFSRRRRATSASPNLPSLSARPGEQRDDIRAGMYAAVLHHCAARLSRAPTYRFLRRRAPFAHVARRLPYHCARTFSPTGFCAWHSAAQHPRTTYPARCPCSRMTDNYVQLLSVPRLGPAYHTLSIEALKRGIRRRKADAPHSGGCLTTVRFPHWWRTHRCGLFSRVWRTRRHLRASRRCLLCEKRRRKRHTISAGIAFIACGRTSLQHTIP